MVAAQVVGGLFDIGVGGLGLLGVHHIDAVVLLHRAGVALHLVGVEDQNDLALAVALIVHQQVGQHGPGGRHVLPGHRLQLLPGEDDVVAVHQEVFRAGLLLPDGVVVIQTGAGGLLLGLEGLVLHLAVGALKDGLELLVLLQ